MPRRSRASIAHAAAIRQRWERAAENTGDSAHRTSGLSDQARRDVPAADGGQGRPACAAIMEDADSLRSESPVRHERPNQHRRRTETPAAGRATLAAAAAATAAASRAAAFAASSAASIDTLRSDSPIRAERPNQHQRRSDERAERRIGRTGAVLDEHLPNAPDCAGHEYNAVRCLYAFRRLTVRLRLADRPPFPGPIRPSGNLLFLTSQTLLYFR